MKYKDFEDKDTVLRAPNSQPSFQFFLLVKEAHPPTPTLLECFSHAHSHSAARRQPLRCLAFCWERETKVEENVLKDIIWRMGKLLSILFLFFFLRSSKGKGKKDNSTLKNDCWQKVARESVLNVLLKVRYCFFLLWGQVLLY